MSNYLLSKLNSPSNMTMNRYLLLDGLSSISGLNSLHIDKLKERYDADRFSIVLRPEIAYVPRNCPQLFLLAGPGEHVDEDLIEECVDLALAQHLHTKKYICGWLVSKYSTNELSEYILSVGHSLGATIESKLFTPFYEPFRLQLLQEGNLICSDWLPMVLNDIDSYYYFSANKELKEITKLNYESKIQNLFITEETKYYQIHEKKINHLYLGWSVYCRDQHKIVDSNDLIKIARLYQQANYLGLTHVQDNFIFSLNSMEYGDLLKDKTLRHEIQGAIADPGSLAMRFQKLDDYFKTL